MEGFHRQKEGGTKKLLAKERTVSGQVIFFWVEGNCKDVIMQITSLVLIRTFQIVCLKVTFLREDETAIKSWFAVLGVNDSIVGLLFLFLKKQFFPFD